MKKVLAATLLCAVSSFATWDLFPAQEAGKGEAKVAFGYAMPQDKVSAMGIALGARYSIIEGLEAALMLNNYYGAGYVISSDCNGDPCKNAKGDDVVGLATPVVGVRYWLPMGLGVAVDAILPFGSEPIVGDEPQFGLNAGVQFSKNFTGELSFGSEAILNVINNEEHGGKTVNMGMNLNLAVEVDYSVGGGVTPWVGIDLQTGLTKGDKSEADKMSMGLSVGATYDISSNMYAQAGYWMGLVGDAYDDSKGGYAQKTVSATYGIKF